MRKSGKSQPPSQPEREAAVRGEALSVGWVSVIEASGIARYDGNWKIASRH
jgi:hypothetical protein